mgnify:CR=1 FL=1
MRIEYDKDVDATYIYISEDIKDDGAKKTIGLNDNIILDFDGEGKLIGVEILDASKVLSKKVLTESDSAIYSIAIKYIRCYSL